MSIEDIKITAATADTYVSDAGNSTFLADTQYNLGVGNVQAAVAALVEAACYLDTATTNFAGSAHYLERTDIFVAMARKTLFDAGLHESKNDLAKQQTELITQLTQSVRENRESVDVVGRIATSLAASTTELKDSMGADCSDLETDKRTIPGVLKEIVEYRNAALAFMEGY